MASINFCSPLSKFSEGFLGWKAYAASAARKLSTSTRFCHSREGGNPLVYISKNRKGKFS